MLELVQQCNQTYVSEWFSGHICFHTDTLLDRPHVESDPLIRGCEPPFIWCNLCICWDNKFTFQ